MSKSLIFLCYKWRQAFLLRARGQYSKHKKGYVQNMWSQPFFDQSGGASNNSSRAYLYAISLMLGIQRRSQHQLNIIIEQNLQIQNHYIFIIIVLKVALNQAFLRLNSQGQEGQEPARNFAEGHNLRDRSQRYIFPPSVNFLI